ncbi:MAG: DUF4382 domain-containing protein [Gemmatimonadota bacterium]|nr:MAG: DUF4382 domain-containing protein [Gemmatimonadota bacterium]
MGSRVGGFAAMALTALLGVTACNSTTGPATESPEDGTTPTADVTGSVSILLTDHPSVDLDEAWVEVTGIYLQGRLDGTNGGSLSAASAYYNGKGNDETGNTEGETNRNRYRERSGDGPGNCDCERVWLLEESTGWIDLLTLADSWVSLVEGAEVPAGTYGQLRFVLGDAAVVTRSGDVYATPGADLAALSAVRGTETTADGELHCPSCTQSGLKVAFRGGIEVAEDADVIFMIDFDVTQSFGHPAGRSGRWIMHPVILGTRLADSGAIGGTVALEEGVTLPACDTRPVTLEDFVPTATPAGDGTQYTGNVGSDGSYEIGPLDAGNYELGFLAQVDVEVDGTTYTISFGANHPASVTVTAGGTAVADYMITSADCSVAG